MMNRQNSGEMVDEQTGMHYSTDAHWQQVLANAINDTDLNDDRLSKRTFGQVSASLIADLRNQKISPLPSWLVISNLLGACHLNPEDIGQSVETVLDTKR